MAPDPQQGSVIVPLRGCPPEASPTLSPPDSQSIWGVCRFPKEALFHWTPSACRRQGGQQYNSTWRKEHQEVRGLAEGHSIGWSENGGKGALEVISRPACSGYRQGAEPGAEKGRPRIMQTVYSTAEWNPRPGTLSLLDPAQLCTLRPPCPPKQGRSSLSHSIPSARVPFGKD